MLRVRDRDALPEELRNERLVPSTGVLKGSPTGVEDSRGVPVLESDMGVTGGVPTGNEGRGGVSGGGPAGRGGAVLIGVLLPDGPELGSGVPGGRGGMNFVLPRDDL